MVGDLVAGADFTIVVLMALLAKVLYVAGYLYIEGNLLPYLTAGSVAGIVFVIALRRQGSYGFDRLSTFGGQMRQIATGLLVSAFVLLGFAYMVKISSEYSRGWMAIWFSLNFLALTLSHYVINRILLRWISYGVFARNIVVYGSGEIAQKLVESFASSFFRTRVCGVFDDLDRGVSPKVMVAGGLSELLNFCQVQNVDEVLIALPLHDERRIGRLVRELSVLPIDIRLCTDMAGFALRPKGIVHHGKVSVLEIERRPLDGWGPVFKTVEDRVIAGLMTLGLLPLFLIVALAIKLDTPGPVFFRQRRHGFNHNVFMVWKFRTMTVEEDGAAIVQAKRGDERVTRVGRWLRRTSLDEIPQLFNVLNGEMSLVGPRPHAIAHNEYYSSLLGTYASRHKVKPGITGWAQVNGLRGETNTPEKMAKRVEYDLQYIENWSLWFDIKILLLTPFSLFSKNAF
ncbi:MAG: undecaprenyl-phosphate glucose phosphotransferase [Parvibaculum sp.]